MTKEEIEKVLDEKIKPYLAMHGGNIEIVEVSEDKTVKVKFRGACAGCAMAEMTLHQIVESILKSNIPDIKKVVMV